jgi:hypothetical protein
MGFNSLAASCDASVAFSLSLLARLSGWLDGFFERIRTDAEARAYAEVREQHEHSRGTDG